MLIWRLFRLEESRVWQEKRRKLKREVRDTGSIGRLMDPLGRVQTLPPLYTP
jgi:hypothetical protein